MSTNATVRFHYGTGLEPDSKTNHCSQKEEWEKYWGTSFHYESMRKVGSSVALEGYAWTNGGRDTWYTVKQLPGNGRVDKLCSRRRHQRATVIYTVPIDATLGRRLSPFPYKG